MDPRERGHSGDPDTRPDSKGLGIHCGAAFPVLTQTDYGPAWVCPGCGARVGCHPGTTEPLGTLADEETRGLRSIVHRFFDPLWREGRAQGARGARGRAYEWLRDHLGLTADECHVGRFDAETCRRALELVGPDEVSWATVERWERERCPDPDPFNDVPDAMDYP